MLTTRSEIHDHSYPWTLAALSIGFVTIHWFLQPRIGAVDVDAFAYIVGSFSLSSGRCYCDLSGGSLIHWPPAYSWLLSLFPDPLIASLWINHLSLILAVAALYFLLRRGGWQQPAATGLCLVWGLGFFLDLAGNAAPDILTYAVFLVGVLFYGLGSLRWRITAYLFWGALVTVKLIAVVFIPGAIAFELIQNRFQVHRSEFTRWSVAGVIEVLVVSSILTFNYRATGYFISPTHPRPSIGGLPNDILRFVASICRSFLWSWHGAIKSLPVVTVFVITILLALFCLLSLRAHGSQRLWLLGLIILLMSFELLLVRHFGAVRLFGYGLVLLVAGCKPTGSADLRWILYGVVAMVVGTINAKINNSLGANDPRYEQLAERVAALGPMDEPIGTNSFHILDIHKRIPSQTIQDANRWRSSSEIPEAPSNRHIQTIVWVRLPRYDSSHSTVWPMQRPGAGWCEIASVPGATVFRRCSGDSVSATP
jgi:hypothetical protein